MFKRILIGIDGGPGGRDALALAQRLGGPDSELLLAAIWDRAAGVAAAVTGGEHPATAAHRALEEARSGLRETLRCMTLAAGSVGAGLHALAESSDADLIVVGSGDGGDAGHARLAPELRSALHGAPCAVAVAPQGFAGRGARIATVGIGYEESAAGEATLRAGCALAGELDAELEILTVIPPLPLPWVGGPFAYLEAFEDIEGVTEQTARERLEARGDFRVTVDRGAPAACLQEFSRTVDLLVLGSRAYGPVRRLLFGSTVDGVLHAASCPVLVLPRPEAAHVSGRPAARAAS